MARREKANYIIRSVSHALDVIEQFFGEADELGVTELSKRLKLHKNNIFRLLATLESRGYIEQNKATENYRLGVRSLRLGQAYVGRMGILRQARPIMETLVKQCRESAFVAVSRRGAMVPLDSVDTDQAVRLVSQIGESLPLHCTAVGKAHLAFEADADLKGRLPEGLKKFTGRTVTERPALVQHLRAIIEAGYAIDEGEYLDDVSSIAVPIRDYTGRMVGTLAVSGPSYRMSSERIEKDMVPTMKKAGNELSSRLGFNA